MTSFWYCHGRLRSKFIAKSLHVNSIFRWKQFGDADSSVFSTLNPQSCSSRWKARPLQKVTSLVFCHDKDARPRISIVAQQVLISTPTFSRETWPKDAPAHLLVGFSVTFNKGTDNCSGVKVWWLEIASLFWTTALRLRISAGLRSSLQLTVWVGDRPASCYLSGCW